MKCYDCQQLDADTHAVGMCVHCGVGVCSEHSEVVRPVVRRFAGPGAPQTRRDTRRIVCATCFEAERGVALAAHN
jgi:hypothetical protein